MSNPGNTPAQSAELTKAQLLGLLRQGLLAVGVLLAGHGLIGPHNTITPERWEFIVGVLVTAAPIVWAWWEKARTLKTWRERLGLGVQLGVQAGINLTAAGQALTVQNMPVVIGMGDVPKPVTPATAAAIVTAFAPPALHAPPAAATALTDAFRAAEGKP